jgi:protein phosphatase 2C family protein 2/3
MGQTLSEPVVEKISKSGGDDRLIFGLSSMQGWRISMEDAHAAILDLQNPEKPTKPTAVEERLSFFGVYDGHAGDRVALFSGENVHKILAKQAAFEAGNFEQALKDGFLATDRAILQDVRYEDEDSGCTASAALLTNDKIYVANAGDSRTVLGVKGRAKPLSFDHKPQNEGEKARIVAAGGFVKSGRVNGNLGLSRAIGDFEFKKSAKLPPEQQIITAYPDVVVHDISDDDEFIVVACDGIWDCRSSQAVVEFVRRGIAAKQDLHKICENMMDNCLSRNGVDGGTGSDNMTMVIIGLLRGKTKEEWYDMIAKRVTADEGPCAPPEYAEFRGPAEHGNFPATDSPDEFDDSPDEFDDSPDEFNAETDHSVKVIHNAIRGGRMIILGDGGEVLTDSDDEELKDEKDDETLPKTPKESSKSEDVEIRDAGASKAASESTPTTTNTTSDDKKEGTAP